jgi:hypothetical protein
MSRDLAQEQKSILEWEIFALQRTLDKFGDREAIEDAVLKRDSYYELTVDNGNVLHLSRGKFEKYFGDDGERVAEYEELKHGVVDKDRVKSSYGSTTREKLITDAVSMEVSAEIALSSYECFAKAQAAALERKDEKAAYALQEKNKQIQDVARKMFDEVDGRLRGDSPLPALWLKRGRSIFLCDSAKLAVCRLLEEKCKAYLANEGLSQAQRKNPEAQLIRAKNQIALEEHCHYLQAECTKPNNLNLPRMKAAREVLTAVQAEAEKPRANVAQLCRVLSATRAVVSTSRNAPYQGGHALKNLQGMMKEVVPSRVKRAVFRFLNVVKRAMGFSAAKTVRKKRPCLHGAMWQLARVTAPRAKPRRRRAEVAQEFCAGFSR